MEHKSLKCALHWQLCCMMFDEEGECVYIFECVDIDGRQRMCANERISGVSGLPISSWMLCGVCKGLIDQ